MAKFHIIECAKQGALTTWQQKEHLLAMSLPATILSALAFFFLGKAVVYTPEADVEKGEDVLNLLPGTDLYTGMAFIILGIALLSYVFVKQSRIMLLDDHDGSQDKNSDSAKKTILYASLFFVGFLVVKHFIDQLFLLVATLIENSHPLVLGIFAAVNVTWVIWFIRFSVAHIPLSINYPLKDFLQTVKGFQFSFYLLGLVFVVLIPYSFAAFTVLSIIGEIVGHLSLSAASLLSLVLGSLAYVYGFLALNAASVHALDQIMREQSNST